MNSNSTFMARLFPDADFFFLISVFENIFMMPIWHLSFYLHHQYYDLHLQYFLPSVKTGISLF